ncbi:MAG: type II toxin-antitoxin system Phd/YefM family antitoxin [Ramlibacter sp.]|nr:type II toxin-antitoxin system Phd/YefM family antitoxin [Ramlibacter sp.]
MPSLTANDLKTRGIAAIEESLARMPEAIISVRGKDRFVVMEVAQYHYLRECELDAALAQSRADEAPGQCIAESAKAHMARLDTLLEEAPVASKRVRAALKE